MPLLRRTHDRHRDVRTVEAAARTAGRNGAEPGERPMTRHGMIQPPAAGTQPPATDPRASMVIIDADRAASSRATGPTTPRGGATKRSVRIHPGASRRRSRHRRHQPKIEIPIAIACGPRVPSSGTFVRLPAPETLHDERTVSFQAEIISKQPFRWRPRCGPKQHKQSLLADGSKPSSLASRSSPTVTIRCLRRAQNARSARRRTHR